jgi:copper ion binding protein
MTTTVRYDVTGMTCGHCVAAVQEEVGKLPGVQRVQVELVAGGSSTVTVTSDAPLDEAQLCAAIDEAGYELAGTGA